MVTVATTLILSYYYDAPLKELANAAVPENPAKAPWYFLGLQELVSYSAFMGGMLIPIIVLVGLALIPFLDRRPGGEGTWFGTSRERPVFWQSLLFACAVTVGMLGFRTFTSSGSSRLTPARCWF
jgi:quinol-cytochrome oxidoreductase complex cytochrome b subunit